MTAGNRTEPAGNQTKPLLIPLIASLLLIGALFSVDFFLATMEHTELTGEARDHYRDGLALLQQNRAPEAVEQLRRAWSLDRANREYQLQYAAALLAAKKLDDAGKQLDDLLQADPNDGPANCWRRDCAFGKAMSKMPNRIITAPSSDPGRTRRPRTGWMCGWNSPICWRRAAIKETCSRSCCRSRARLRMSRRCERDSAGCSSRRDPRHARRTCSGSSFAAPPMRHRMPMHTLDWARPSWISGTIAMLSPHSFPHCVAIPMLAGPRRK